MKRNGGGFGQSGPRTNEQKDWLSTAKSMVLLTIIIWIALCALWFSVSVVSWLVDPHSPIAYWFKERPRVWLAVNVALGIPCIVVLVIRARQELLDEDWTSLQGHHGLSGIVPMTPIVRMILFFRWLRAQPRPERKNRISKFLEFLLGSDEDEQ